MLAQRLLRRAGSSLVLRRSGSQCLVRPSSNLEEPEILQRSSTEVAQQEQATIQDWNAQEPILHMVDAHEHVAVKDDTENQEGNEHGHSVDDVQRTRFHAGPVQEPAHGHKRCRKLTQHGNSGGPLRVPACCELPPDNQHEHMMDQICLPAGPGRSKIDRQEQVLQDVAHKDLATELRHVGLLEEIRRAEKVRFVKKCHDTKNDKNHCVEKTCKARSPVCLFTFG
mmetsp:Transcript_23272/g.54966  ORF Transcript_23272/g.54966 Transcript_23272/m.54966 type:complete len:225 (-) Transcript_23272:165-839(-)